MPGSGGAKDGRLDRPSPAMAPDAAGSKRLGWTLFFLLFVTYAYFFQGGGWNQNSRFDQVRAVVEQGRLSINDYLLYRGKVDAAGHATLVRVPLVPGTPWDEIDHLVNTGDVARVAASGLIYPNKPPGTVLLAVPGYFVIHNIERLAGLDPDDWWVLTVNHYLTTLFSVGLIAALGGVLFLRVSRFLMPSASDLAHAAATLAFGLGTLMLPFATVLFDHVEAAVFLLAAFYGLLRAGSYGLSDRRRSLYLLAAGAAAGMSVVINYLSVIVVLLLAVYAVLRCGLRARTALFLAGGLPFVLLLAAYHAACFGAPFTIANTFESEAFKTEGLWLGVFAPPQADVAWRLLLGTRRGLFFTSPVLVLGLVGALLSLRSRHKRVPVVLCLLVFVLYWLINASFKQWHSGFAIGPRYMIPALPFACLWMANAFRKLPRLTLAAAALSIVILLFATAVDAQPPPAFPNPLVQYHLPLVRDGAVAIQEIRIEGPVSANPIGSWEGWYHVIFPAASPQVRWSSFNLGEFLWPRSLASLLPLVLFLAGGVLFVVRRTAARRTG